MIEKDQIDKKVDFDKYISIAKKNIYQFIDIKNTRRRCGWGARW